MTIVDNPPSGFELVDLVNGIEGDMQPLYNYDAVIFPMITYDQEVDISWIKRLYTIGNDGRIAKITQALQQTKFRMNEKGAKVESAVAMVVTRECVMMSKPDLVIDRPFVLWIRRPGLSQPFFVGYFTKETWKKPESL